MQFTELLWGLNGFPDIPCCQMPSTVIQTTVYKLSYYIGEKNREEGLAGAGKHKIRLLFKTISLAVSTSLFNTVSSAT